MMDTTRNILSAFGVLAIILAILYFIFGFTPKTLANFTGKDVVISDVSKEATDICVKDGVPLWVGPSTESDGDLVFSYINKKGELVSLILNRWGFYRGKMIIPYAGRTLHLECDE